MMILRYFLSIVFVSAFLILSTVFVFMPSHSQMASALSFLSNSKSLSFIAISDDLALEKNYPIADEVGQITKAYEFQIKNQGVEEQRYQISFFTGDSDTSLEQSAIHYVIQKNGDKFSEVQTLAEDGIIVSDTIIGKNSENFAIKFWVHDENDLSIQGKTFQGIMSLNVLQ